MGDEQRIKRLVGDVSGKGGLPGLPLPDAFGKVLELLLDNQTVSADELTKVISVELEYKKALVFAAYHRSWKAFTRDLIDQLLAEEFITPVGADGFYALTPKVVPRTSLDIIPGHDVRVTVFTAPDRVQNEEMASIILTLNELKERVRKQGRLTIHLANAFTQLASSVETGKEPLRSGRRSVGTTYEPDDEPDAKRMCMGKCGEDKPLTRDYWSVSISRGMYYWNRKCNDCLRDYPTKKQTTEYRKLILAEARLADDGTQPSLEQVMERTGMSELNVKRVWDELAAEGRLESRRT